MPCSRHRATTPVAVPSRRRPPLGGGWRLAVGGENPGGRNVSTRRFSCDASTRMRTPVQKKRPSGHGVVACGYAPRTPCLLRSRGGGHHPLAGPSYRFTSPVVYQPHATPRQGGPYPCRWDWGGENITSSVCTPRPRQRPRKKGPLARFDTFEKFPSK